MGQGGKRNEEWLLHECVKDNCLSAFYTEVGREPAHLMISTSFLDR